MNGTALRALDWTPPAFLLRGARLIADNPDCRGSIASPRGPGEAQEAASFVGGPSIAPEPKTPVLSAPAPALAASEAQTIISAPQELLPPDPERAAALAELEAISAKQGIGTSGLALAVQLRRLMAAHAIGPNPEPWPLALLGSLEPQGAGLCGDGRHRRRPAPVPARCFGKIDRSKIRLLLKHDPKVIAGTVDDIELDALGRLVVVCTVTHPLAMRMPAFSIGASVENFTIRNPDSAGVYGEVEEAVLDEISLTERPGNRNALVLERYIPSALDLSNEAVLAKLKAVQASMMTLQASGFFARAA